MQEDKPITAVAVVLLLLLSTMSEAVDRR